MDNKITKAAAGGVASDAGSATAEELELINTYTRRTLTADEVYVFTVVLCDNDVDRDGERFTVESLFRIGLYVIYGILTWEILKQALCLAPVMLLGLFSGIYCCRWLSERAVKRFVVVMLIICGITLVINNL